MSEQGKKAEGAAINSFNTIEKIVAQLESCNYECEGGNLENNVAFVALKKMALKSSADGNLTVEKLKAMKPGTIIMAGETENSPNGIYMTDYRKGDALLYVARRGGAVDWAIYAGWKEDGFDAVLKNGQKVVDKSNIRKLVPCDNEALSVYRS